MTLTIETVPESIPFERVQELVRSLGLDVNDVASLSLDYAAVTAEVYARNAEGQRYFRDGRGDVAMHQVRIPIVREP